jgi:hypothetical protein
LQDGGDFSGFGIILQYEMMVDSIHGSWTTRRRRLGATGARQHARRSLVSDHPGARKLAGEGRVWRGEDSEAGAALTRAR